MINPQKIYCFVLSLLILVSCQPRQTPEEESFFVIKDTANNFSSTNKNDDLDSKHGFKNIVLGKNLNDFDFNLQNWRMTQSDSDVGFIYVENDLSANQKEQFSLNGKLASKVMLYFYDSVLFSIEVYFIPDLEKNKIFDLLEANYGNPVIKDQDYVSAGYIKFFVFDHQYKLFKTELNNDLFVREPLFEGTGKKLFDKITTEGFTTKPKSISIGRNIIDSNSLISVWQADSTMIEYIQSRQKCEYYNDTDGYIKMEKRVEEYDEFMRVGKINADLIALELKQRILDKRQMESEENEKDEYNKLLKEGDKL